MSETLTAGAALPTYARMIDSPGGAWRRWWLHAVLRMTAKHQLSIDADIGHLRAKQEKVDRRLGKVDPEVRQSVATTSEFRADWLDVPESRPGRVLLYLHGGAFLLRFPRTHAALASGWCRALGSRALMVDYRLAPEHRFPAAIDDCHAAYRWLLEQGTDPRDVVIAGDSAGGNLTLATLHRIAASREPMPACAVLLSPFVDFTLSGVSLIRNERSDPMFTFVGLAALRTLYLSPESFLDPSASPLFGDFSGFPPLLFHAGGDEMLLDEATRAAARAHAAGVAVEFEIWRNMAHVFQILPLPQAAHANQRIVDFIARKTQWGRSQSVH